MKPAVYEVPKELDTQVARTKLETMGMRIDKLTSEQVQYIRGYGAGT